MSIIIHFNAASFIPSSVTLPSASSCISRAKTKLKMVPGIDQTDRTVMTDDENSMVDIATSNTLYTHTISDLKSNHVLGSCFGLPYQDHNYGAPPPPTPPSYSPCNSPPHANGVPDEDTNLSVVSTSTVNGETQDASITRCICGFEHDDEYMICCDNCLVWQHVDCMGLDRNNIPETYLCEKCQPRKVDRHKAKVLQTRKKIRMTDSSDSDDDHGKNSEKKTRTRSKRRRKEEDKTDKIEHGGSRRSRNLQKHKERMEAKSARLRRTKNKESTSTADEEAQDAWEISLEWCEKNFETAITNQYTPEVQHLARTLSIQGHERRFMELLVTKHCKIVDGNQKRLISIYDIPRNQPLIEYVGKFLLSSQFYELHPAFSKRLFPFVMFYSLDQEEICVDASVYGNEARFVRRSCKPNAELHHLVYNGNLHLYISSTKAVFKDDEITLPLDFNLKESIKDMECACESDDCILKFHQKNSSLDMNDKRKRGRKLTFSADDDSSHSFVGANASPTKSRPSPSKSASQTGDHTDGKSDLETEEQANERKKKTREERKIDAIMRAFDQMEKAAKRRQQALERQKAHHPKSEESSDKPEPAPIPKEEDKVTTASGSETQGGEDEKVHIPTRKPKKGKRRRGSGTSSRRRTRTNSGGSDILSPEESIQPKTVSTASPEVVENPETVETISITTTCSTTTSVASVSSTPVTPPVLKTKRLLLHEWLQQEKSDTTTTPPITTPPVAVRTEVKWSPTCYVQCTKDNSHSSGISAAHLRRSSASGPIKSYPIKSCSEQGSAKKRWLRQAMYDNNSYDDPLIIDPGGMEALHLDNCDLSPDGHGEMGSPGAADDTVTPLKKRRLIRESIESTSSPLSPTPHNLEGASSLLSLASNEIKTETHSDTIEEQLSTTAAEDSSCSDLTLKLEENMLCKVKNIKAECEYPKESIKEEESVLEILMNASPEPNPLVETPDATVLTECTGVEPSMQTNCDPEVKNDDTIKNESVQGDLNLFQKDSNYDNVEQSVHLCSDKNMQSNLQTPESNTPVSVQTVLNESTTQTNSVKRKIIFSSEQCKALICSASEDNSTCTQDMQSDSLESNNKVSVPLLEETSFDTKGEHSPSKSKESVNKVLSDNSSILPVNSDGTKDNFSDPAPQCPKLHISVSPVKNVNASVSVSFDCRSEQVNSVDNPEKILTDLSITEPDVLCCNSSSSDHVNSNHEKSEECSHLDCKFSHLSNENSSLAVKATCASATQKRKVSLSEYRMRMKEGTCKRSSPEAVKRLASSSSVSGTAIPETLPEQVTLAPLPLFDTTIISQSPPQPAPVKTSKKKKEVVKIEESFCDVIEHRENLTERLKREFGFDEDSDECILTSNSIKTVSGGASSAVIPNAQPPPPPPPPPPRPSRPLQSSMSVTATAVSPSQFGFSMQTSYARPSYIVSQVPSAQFIPVQQAVTTPIMPSIHPATTPVIQCNIRGPLLQSPHSFASSLPGNVLQPPIQHEYSSVNAQSYAALVQQPPPPPPPPKSYSHVYQPGLYK